jgi:hypothetical protein
MTTPASAFGEVAVGGIYVRVTGPNGFCGEYELPPGDALVVGTSPACGVRIEGPGIAAMHCTLSCEDGLLVIDDWDTGAGTYLDGQRIARQASADPGATVQIGSYRFETAPADDESAPAEAAHAQQPHVPPPGYDVEDSVDDTDPFLPSFEASAGHAEQRDAWSSPAARGTRPEYEDDADDVHQADDDANSDDAYDVYDSAADLGEYDAPVDEPPAYARGREVGADEMTELLKTELDYLRTELADRDARVAELERSLEGAGGAVDADLPTREEVDTLAGRLEDLLAELEHSDERLKTMSELLRVSEEANLASVEERTQMEAWMGEVERRVGAWESERQAERESLSRRIAELTAQRDEAETRGGSRENTALLQKLRQQISQYEAETAKLQAQRDELQQRLQAADVESIEDRIESAVNEAMREERLQLSQERADFARERAAILKQQEELAQQPSSHTSSADIADLKIRAFREHLREVRANEPEHRPAPSMSQRLGKLWRKLDGRPLDTD